jgi:hypothetical protein
LDSRFLNCDKTLKKKTSPPKTTPADHEKTTCPGKQTGANRPARETDEKPTPTPALKNLSKLVEDV